MSIYLLDTNHISAVFKNQHLFIDRVESTGGPAFGVPLPAVGELWFMVYKSARIRQNTDDLNEVLKDYRFWPFGNSAAMEFGRIKAELKAQRTVLRRGAKKKLQ